MESILQALQGVFSHKLRSFLTMLGIIIGIASIITIISTIKGTSEQIKENLIGAGNNVVLVELYQDDYAYEMSYNPIPGGVTPLDNDVKKELNRLDGISQVSFFCLRQNTETVFFRNTGSSASIYGIDEDYFSVNGYGIKTGRGFSEKDSALKRNVVILDESATKALFGTKDPIGQVIEIKQIPFTVVGVAARSSAFRPVINSEEDYNLYAEQNGGTIFLPIASWPLVYYFDEPQNVAIRAESTDAMASAGKAVADYLNSHQVAEKAVKDGMKYRNNDLLKQAEQLQQMSNATNKQLIWIAGISLLVGGVGVSNIMLVTVTERTGEIGLKKAIGAKRRRILGQFLTEAAVLTGIGGLLGVLVGIGMSKLISGFVDTPTAISIPAVFAAALFSVLIGLVFGFFPAVKASKLNPIEALRRE